MSYTDSYGEVYPESYWKPASFNFTEADQVGNIVFYGYPNAAQKGKRIIGQKSYQLSAEQISGYLMKAPPDGTTVRKAMLSLAYKLAKETKDVNAGTPEEPNNVSYFENGLDV